MVGRGIICVIVRPIFFPSVFAFGRSDPPLLLAYTTVWSNFEIADMDFWRSPAYSAYFEHLEAKGGFYYEVRLFYCSALTYDIYRGSQRWGDAPVHSIGAALFARKEQIHFFNDIGNATSIAELILS